MAHGRAVAAVLALAALAGGACSSDGDGGTTQQPTPVSSDKTVATPPTAIDVSTIPAKIDEPYINAVLAGLNVTEGEVIRIIVENKQLVSEAARQLRAIYDENEFQDQVELWLQQIKDGLEDFKENPGPPRSTVLRTFSASPDCILLEVEDDVSAFLENPGKYTRQFLQLIPLDRSRDRDRINRTAWMIHQAGLRSDGSDPGDLCAD